MTNDALMALVQIFCYVYTLSGDYCNTLLAIRQLTSRKTAGNTHINCVSFKLKAQTPFVRFVVDLLCISFTTNKPTTTSPQQIETSVEFELDVVGLTSRQHHVDSTRKPTLCTRFSCRPTAHIASSSSTFVCLRSRC